MPRLRVSVNRLREGMVVKEDVYAKTGVILVMEGTCVTKEVIGLLTRHLIEEVIVEYSNDKREPAIPVFTRWVTPNTLHRIWAHMAALTLPTPHWTTTVFSPSS